MVAHTSAAGRLGVRCGMRRGSARMLAPDALVLQRDAGAEQQALHDLTLALLQYTPQLTQAEGAVILLDVAASLRLFGGPRGLARRVRRTVSAMHLSAQLAMAPTAGGAWLLARQTACRQRRVLQWPALARRLDALPCAVLPAAQAHAGWLNEIGCRTLGGLRRLPRAGLQRRTGAQLLESLDCAYGRKPEIFAWFTPPATFRQRVEMPERTERLEAAWFAVEYLVEQMCGWLQARQQATGSVLLAFEHERGRQAVAPTELHVRLARPAAQPEHVLRLLRERLARLASEATTMVQDDAQAVRLPASFCAVRLEVLESQPQASVSGELFADAGGMRLEQVRLLEVLGARLGEERVLVPAPVADHRPEYANRWRGWQAAAPTPLTPGSGPALSGPAWRRVAEAAGERPFFLLPEPRELSVQQHRPVYGSSLRLLHGPERIEAGWWSGQLTARDYFVAEDDHHARYWVYRERDSHAARWFLHGVFA